MEALPLILLLSFLGLAVTDKAAASTNNSLRLPDSRSSTAQLAELNSAPRVGLAGAAAAFDSPGTTGCGNTS